MLSVMLRRFCIRFVSLVEDSRSCYDFDWPSVRVSSGYFLHKLEFIYIYHLAMPLIVHIRGISTVGNSEPSPEISATFSSLDRPFEHITLLNTSP